MLYTYWRPLTRGLADRDIFHYMHGLIEYSNPSLEKYADSIQLGVQLNISILQFGHGENF